MFKAEKESKGRLPREYLRNIFTTSSSTVQLFSVFPVSPYPRRAEKQTNNRSTTSLRSLPKSERSSREAAAVVRSTSWNINSQAYRKPCWEISADFQNNWNDGDIGINIIFAFSENGDNGRENLTNFINIERTNGQHFLEKSSGKRDILKNVFFRRDILKTEY